MNWNKINRGSVFHFCKFVPDLINNTMHTGKQLAKAIKALGLKKIVLAKELKISRPTLAKRIKDGEFTPKQSKIVLEIISHYTEVKCGKASR